MAAVTRTGLLVLLVMACASMLAGLLVPLCTPRPTPGVTLANFLRVRYGTPIEEVVALFGKQPDSVMPGRGGGGMLSWRAGGSEAHVTFRVDGAGTSRALNRSFSRPGEPDVSLPPEPRRWPCLPFWPR